MVVPYLLDCMKKNGSICKQYFKFLPSTDFQTRNRGATTRIKHMCVAARDNMKDREQ